jgi:soluble lytic murein transglycosylase
MERGSDGLRGAAAANWAEFGKLWRADRYDEAAAFLARITGAPHKLGTPELWAGRREALARRMARMGRPELGYELARQHHLGPADGADYAELEWLAGWIALRKLGDARRAIPHFERFLRAVETPISLGRGGYWLGRAYEALGDGARAAEWYRAGAAHQTAFYGQLAAAKLGLAGNAEIAGAALPDWSKSPVLRSDEVRAGVLLHFAGEEELAFSMFSELGRQLDGGAALGALAGLGLELGQPHYAVRIAKHAARKGVILYAAYYPVTELANYAREVEPALAMAIARQETELNPRAISPAGARGLMQLMPATARKVAGRIGEPYSGERLLDDWQYNARLGQSYLAEQIAAFGGSYVLAAAAYNAGPNRVDQWLGEFGDPRLPGTDMIDWIESIPFGETRNYVQRVIEGLYVYRARLSGTAGPMTIAHDLMRGVRGGCEGGSARVASLAAPAGVC